MPKQSHNVIHLLHDAGLAAWTGGSLMGAVGLNGAAATLTDPRQRASAATAGWSRWAPVNAAAIAAHVVGGIGLTITDRERVRNQKGVAGSSAAKAAVTGVGLGVAAWSAVLNRKMAASVPVPVEGSTEPGPGTPSDVARVQRQLKVVQWLNPLVGLSLHYLTAVHEEQRRPASQLSGRLQTAVEGLRTPRGAATAGAVALGIAAARRRRARRDVEVVEVVELTEVGVVDLTGTDRSDVGVPTATSPVGGGL